MLLSDRFMSDENFDQLDPKYDVSKYVFPLLTVPATRYSPSFAAACVWYSRS